MQKAMIEDGKIVNLIEFTPGEDIPDWLAALPTCPEGLVSIGMLWDGDHSSRPVRLPETEQKARLVLAEAVLAIEQTAYAGISDIERASLPEKLAAARAIVSGIDRQGISIVQAEADITGEDVRSLAQKIIRKAENSALIAAKAAGIRRKFEAQIVDGANFDEIINAINADASSALA